MPVFIQIAGLLENLFPDPFWIGLLTTAFFSIICFADDLGLITSLGNIRTFELSVVLAYVSFVAMTHRGSCLAPRSPESAATRKDVFDHSEWTVHDEVE